MNNLVSTLGQSLKKHSPEILAAVGVLGTITGVIFACKATMKAPEIVEDHKKRVDEIKNGKELEDGHKALTPEEDKGKEIFKTYMMTGMAFAKLYGPSVTLITLSIGSMLGSNMILRKRNAALTSTLLGVNTAFKKYRDNVIDRFGEEVDYEIEHGIKKMEIQDEETDPETGKKKKVKKVIDVADKSSEGIYTKYFTRHNPYWDELEGSGGMNEDYLRMFFNGRISELEAELRSKRFGIKDRFLILNKAFSKFGFEEEAGGLIPCWIYDESINNGHVDIQYKKVHLRDEYGKFEEAFAVTFRPTHNALTGEVL